jgi:hypothetical protein
MWLVFWRYTRIKLNLQWTILDSVYPVVRRLYLKIVGACTRVSKTWWFIEIYIFIHLIIFYDRSTFIVIYTKKLKIISWQSYQCGGGVEYLHHDPSSRRRRRKEMSQIWESKIWSPVPRDSDPRKTALARVSSTYKRQIRPLVREGAPQEQDRNCLTSNKDLDVSPKWVLYSKTDWPAYRRS